MVPVGLRYVIPPGIPEDIIFREKLCRELLQNKKRSLIVINTSAGYGKTVLLADYSLRYLKNVCWLNSHANITSPGELTLYFIHSFKSLNDSFGIQLIDYIASIEASGTAGNAAELITLFINEFINTFQEEISFIIDDFQNLEQDNKEWINIYFDEFLSTLPQNLKIIISTRQKPEFKTARLEAKRNIFMLSTEDLAFSESEITVLSKKIYRRDCSAEYTAALKQKTNGWITAVHLILQSGGKYNDITQTENLYDFFTEDIFASLDEEVKNFLLSTSILRSFTIPVCAEFLGINNADEIIKKITSKNIFIDKFSINEEIHYSYQKLFSDFLTKHLAEVFTLHEISSLYLKAANIYNSLKNFDKAIQFYITAGCPENAASIINSNFSKLYDNAEYRVLKEWFAVIPQDFLNSNTVLLYNYLKYCVSENRIGSNFLEKLNFLLQSKEKKDWKFYIKLTLIRAEHELITGKTETALKTIEKINIEEFSDMQSETYTLLTKIYYRMGFNYYDDLIKVGETALEIINKNGSIKQKLEVVSCLAIINYDKGSKYLAIKYFKEIIEINSNSYSNFKYLTTLITLYSDIGNYAEASKYIELANNLYIKLPIPLFERLLLKSITKFNFSLGDFNNCIKILEQIVQISTIKDNPTLLLSNLLSIVEAYYFLGNKNLARQNYELTLGLFKDSDNYFNELNRLFIYYYTIENISTPKTEEALLSLLEFHLHNKIMVFIPSIQFYLANHYFLAGNPESSLRYLKKAIDVFASKNELVWCSNELHITRHLFDFAIANDMHKPFIQNVFSFTKDKLGYDWLRPEFRLELEVKIEKLTDIKFLPFGNTEFYLRGEAVAEDKWIRKKSKILLAYLMSDPERVHTKDKIMDMFFDDMPADKADVAYHSAIYNIRTALKIYDIKSDKPKRSKDKTYDYNPQYLLYEDKTLRLNPDFYYIAQNIEFEKLFGKAKLPSTSKEEKIAYSVKAIDMYKSDFMPGYYDSWCEELRVKYKNMFITLSEELIRLLESEERYEEVIQYSDKVLKEDKLNELVHLGIINAYSKLGSVNMARSHYELMLKLYNEELGEQPQTKTLEKINLILNEVKDI